MLQIRFRLGLRKRASDPLAELRGLLLRGGMGWRGHGREDRERRLGKRNVGEGREGREGKS